LGFFGEAIKHCEPSISLKCPGSISGLTGVVLAQVGGIRIYIQCTYLPVNRVNSLSCDVKSTSLPTKRRRAFIKSYCKLIAIWPAQSVASSPGDLAKSRKPYPKPSWPSLAFSGHGCCLPKFIDALLADNHRHTLATRPSRKR